ncbi:MAG: VWA domain-containing protein [Anaerolineales bacterium]|jgi:Ca-activated chloride channel family protein|nr:VWA domain-containing protein [Anaerolineales bacterium]MBK8823732.1 VWA domain-containing protein [Anaerolineales bacterium]
MSAKKPDYYAVLGVFRDASPEDIKHAYFEAAQKLHPDKNVAAGETELFLEVQQAYEVLSNPKRRNLYDATLPPDIESNSVVKHEVFFSRPNLVRLNEEQLLYVLLEISPREESEKLPTPPLNICLVLDRSTSMQGDKMDMVKATAIQLLRGLRAEDVLSVVAFSDRAEVIIPASIETDRRKQEGRIQMIQPSGATEIFNGLKAGMQEIRRTLNPSRINHIILLTDGQTYGDEQDCLNLAEEAAAQNIGITGMGIGHEWNDIFLDALASKTGGSSAYISKPKDIQRFLVDKFNALASTYADDVILDFKPQEHVKVNYAFRLQPEGGNVQVETPMRLGPILRDMPLHVLIEFVVSPEALVDDVFILLEGSLKLSIAARSTPIPPIRIKLDREVRVNPSAEPPPTRILSALSRLTLYRMQDRARSAADDGQYDTAVRHLHNLATHLLSQGEHSLAKTALFEADNLERMHSWSASGNKDIKYSTRALLLSGVKEKGK